MRLVAPESYWSQVQGAIDDAEKGAVVEATARGLVDEGTAAAMVAGGVDATETPTPRGAKRDRVRTIRVPSMLLPYLTEEAFERWVAKIVADQKLAAARLGPGKGGLLLSDLDLDVQRLELPPEVEAMLQVPDDGDDAGGHYDTDLYGAVARYAQRAVALALSMGEHFDLVHAHDWMTFPAGVAVARALNKPLVVHVHSLEHDRSGEWGNPMIRSIEKLGLEGAQRVIAVSHYTKKLIHKVHGTPLDHIDVVHNGVYQSETVAAYKDDDEAEGPLVLFLGRVTYQKGPDYFVEAAAKVAREIPKARFMLAGSGDMLPRLEERVAALGLSDRFEFPGFLKGADVERAFTTADVYVMPSVSEPFGITALEAMSYETPVILSRQSGAAELLRHALKVDFWDVDRLASLIVATLQYPELHGSLVEMAREEAKRVHWDAAAKKAVESYTNLLRES